jgi:hypothetical protein
MHPVVLPIAAVAALGALIFRGKLKAAAVTADNDAHIVAGNIQKAAGVAVSPANQPGVLKGADFVSFQAKTDALGFNPLAGNDGPHLDIRTGDLVTVDIATSGLNMGGTTGNALFRVTRVGPETDASQLGAPQLQVFGISDDLRIPVELGSIPIRRASITGVQPGDG